MAEKDNYKYGGLSAIFNWIQGLSISFKKKTLILYYSGIEIEKKEKLLPFGFHFMRVYNKLAAAGIISKIQYIHCCEGYSSQ